MTPFVDALVLHTTRFTECCAFYRAVGLPLVDEVHDDGPAHVACEVGSVHFALYRVEDSAAGTAPARRTAGSTMLGFKVDGLDELVQTLTVLKGVRLLSAPESVPWGRRAVLADPDGRPVELNQG